MSFLGGPSPPIVLWIIFLVLSNLSARPFLQSGQTSFAAMIYAIGFFLIGLTYYLWRYKHWHL